MHITYRPLNFTPQDGLTVTASLRTLTDSRSHRLGNFEFAGEDGSFFQDQSISGRVLPITIILSGLDIQEQLSLWRFALDTLGIGLLEHPDPTIGNVKVVTVSYTVNQSLIQQGRINIDINFQESIENLLESDVTTNAPDDILAKLENLNVAVSEELLTQLNTVDSSAVQRTVEIIKAGITSLEDNILDLAKEVDAINQQFVELLAEILNTIDSLARSPLDLARNIQNLILFPVFAIDSIERRVNNYSSYVRSVLGPVDTLLPSDADRNKLAMISVQAIVGVSAVAYSAVTSKYSTRSSVLDTVQNILALQVDTIQALTAGELIFNGRLIFRRYFDQGGLLHDIVSLAVTTLLQIIIELPIEKREILIEDEHPLVVFERLSNTLDVEQYTNFLEFNNIIGDELWLLNKGREIVI